MEVNLPSPEESGARTEVTTERPQSIVVEAEYTVKFVFAGIRELKIPIRQVASSEAI